MIKSYKRLIKILILWALFFSYFISVTPKNDLYSNILSFLAGLFASFFIISEYKNRKEYKFYITILFLIVASWTLADFLWLIYANVLHIDPESNDLISAIYVLPNFYFVVYLTTLIYKNSSLWNLKQIVVDMVTVAIIGTMVVWGIILSNTDVRFDFATDKLIIVIYLFFNLIVVTEIGVIALSRGIRAFNKSILYMALGFIIYISADFYYSYSYLVKKYEPNSYLDVVYMLSNVFFTLGAVYIDRNPPSFVTIGGEEFPENIKQPKKIILIYGFLFLIFYLTNIFNFDAFAFSLLLILFNWGLTNNIRSNMLQAMMLKREQKMNQDLENLVRQRTQELLSANKKLEDISNQDLLTGLYNRRYLNHFLNTSIDVAEPKPFALLYIDINHFKSINDAYGHVIGDLVLKALAERFNKLFDKDCVKFRLGGDEFAIILTNAPDRNKVDFMATSILQTIEQPIFVSTYKLILSASIGISMFPSDATDAETLLRYSDVAMYEVKNGHHKNSFMHFSTELIEKIDRKKEIEFELQNADYDKEFVLYYQPQYSTITRKLIGMEALVRWFHPTKGMISPANFIPIAEESGAIIPLGAWILNKAIEQIKQWNTKFELDLKVSINVSPVQVEDTEFIEFFTKKMNEYDINPNWVDLEITESSVMYSLASMEELFNQLDAMGVSSSIDDFGTGYSSLSYIKKFSVDRLKIAKELVDNIENDENTSLIVNTIIKMTKGLNLKTIAEGVEDITQLEIIENLGCDEIQGFIFGKSVPPDTFEMAHILPIKKQVMFSPVSSIL